MSGNLAPTDESWHVLYVKAMCRIQEELFDLMQHEAFKDAEDLGDWCDGLSTLMSFRPQTRDDFELQGRQAFEAEKEVNHGQA